ncbi:hypothetical protein NE690_14825, partial [Coprococcus eutactus]|nr:hypothetical protein [Coprococcus eutactus]
YGIATFEGPMMSIKTINSLSHYTDWTVALVHAGYARYREVLLGGGVDLYELKTLHRKRISLMGSSRASLHTKAVVVDGQ